MILILTPFYSPNVGGVEVHLSEYIDFLNKKKAKATVLTYQPVTINIKAPFKEKTGRINIFRFPYPGFNLFYSLESRPGIQFLYLFSGIFFYSFFFLIFNHKKVKVIHGHGLATAFAAGLLGKIFNKKVVVSLHTIYKFSERPGNSYYAKKILGMADRILAIAQGCKDDLTAIGIDESKITVYSYWVNTEKFKPMPQLECREKLGLSNKGKIGLFVGRFNPEKQVKEALETAKLLPKIDFLFIGHGPLEKKIKECSVKYKNIKLIGRVDNQKIPLYHNAADFLILGSVDEDYFGKVTMEAMSSGLPVILSKESCYFGKLKEVNPKILPPFCGFMFPLNPKIISEELKKIPLSSDSKMKIFRKNCRNFALKHFSVDNALIIYNSYFHD